ncbi:MAG TPA: serine protease [Candidatus Angelobacter sp.]|nr:serine protease [Candidatus Angelobacter sp.]
MTKSLRALAFCAAYLTVFAGAQGVQAVVPITKLSANPLQLAKFGSGFCLDPECQYIVTNYHVAQMMGKNFSIQGEPVVESWLASGLHDEGATKVGYNPLHDLALLKLRQHLYKKGFHGLEYNMTDIVDLSAGEDVDIYAFPLEFNPKRSLAHFHGKYIGTSNPQGMLAFSYKPNPEHLHGGASGGLILDNKGRVLAVLADIALNREDTVLGVPVSVLANFVKKVQPYIAADTFPDIASIAPVYPDIYPEWRPQIHAGLVKRTVEPEDTQLLRQKAKQLIKNLQKISSIQSYDWGRGNDSNMVASAKFEVFVKNGEQYWREYPNGEKILDEVPLPQKNTIEPGDAWMATPEVVATNYNLQINQAPDSILKGRTIKVFQYFGGAEDQICSFDLQTNWGFHVSHHVKSFDCWGEVWTDEDTNILRVSKNYRMYDLLDKYREVVMFDWSEIDGVKFLLPVTVDVHGDNKGHVLWCRGAFTQYSSKLQSD